VLFDLTEGDRQKLKLSVIIAKDLQQLLAAIEGPIPGEVVYIIVQAYSHLLPLTPRTIKILSQSIEMVLEKLTAAVSVELQARQVTI